MFIIETTRLISRALWPLRSGYNDEIIATKRQSIGPSIAFLLLLAQFSNGYVYKLSRNEFRKRVLTVRFYYFREQMQRPIKHFQLLPFSSVSEAYWIYSLNQNSMLCGFDSTPELTQIQELELIETEFRWRPVNFYRWHKRDDCQLVNMNLDLSLFLFQIIMEKTPLFNVANQQWRRLFPQPMEAPVATQTPNEWTTLETVRLL